ncbi:MAG: hypothetical protein Q3Y00_15680 [Bacteroides sp.]|uniref:hypothetical protein n=1 Tax=Bacteroides sp. TaxID=29523 RepID=UPI002847A1BE|nr:hypothetical protein [Bacteroides sp.]MDR3883347.1 hypothetical protein [Bacteroides sp.]
MKARIKATEEIVEVEGLFDVGTALVNGRYFKVSELDFFDNFETIDWEQRRYELAKSAMQGYCIALGINDDSETYDDIAIGSLRVADALIKKLKGK